MATPRNNLQDQRSRLQQLGAAGSGSPFVAVHSPLVAGRRGNALPLSGTGTSDISAANKAISSVKSIGLRASYQDALPPMLTNTGQPLKAPPLPQTTVNAALLPKDMIESRGRKRPSAEHREEPPTSRLRREVSIQQTPQRYRHEENVGFMQHAGPSSVSRPQVGDAGDRSNTAQTWEIPGVTTLLSHLAPNQCQARLNWCNRELVKLMQLKMNAMLGGEELEDPEMITCQIDLLQRRIKLLESHMKDSSSSSRTGSIIGTPVSRITERSPTLAHEHPVASVTKWREEIPHVADPHVEHGMSVAAPVPSSQREEELPSVVQRQEGQAAQMELDEMGLAVRTLMATGPDRAAEGSSRYSRQMASVPETSFPRPQNLDSKQQHTANTVEDDVEMQVLQDSADEQIDDYEGHADGLPAEDSMVDIVPQRQPLRVQNRQPSPPPRPTSIPARPASPIRTEQRPIATRKEAQALSGGADQVFTGSPMYSSSPIRANAQLPIATPAARQPPVTVVPSTKRSAPVLAPTALPPPPPEPKFPWSNEMKRVLKETFGLQSFRSNQQDAINTTMKGEDVFVLMPTGGGKSLCYQLPAVCSRGKTSGVSVVLSPLISLINDQCAALISKDIPTIAFTGELNAADRRHAQNLLALPNTPVKIVYTTPEMLANSPGFHAILKTLHKRRKLARFVIDEAHCVSGWGHDFRPDYRGLGNLKKQYPGVPLMALTATANGKVQDDVKRSLGIYGCRQIAQSFNRPNLKYSIRPKKPKTILEDINSFIRSQPTDSSGIIYCSSRDGCEKLAGQLRDTYGLAAYYYHAGMSKADRVINQMEWQKGKFNIMVATVAFGMGIDKADVRWVVHYALPRSLEGYYQETGRAGRDGLVSDCALFYHYGDSKSAMQMIARDKELTEEQKERQREALRAVLRYCSNKVDCRRTQVLGFFGEHFDPKRCNNTCDVCLSRGTEPMEMVDVTERAKTIIKLVAAIPKPNKRNGDKMSDGDWTMPQAVECLKGLKGRSGKPLDENPCFGQGSSWERGEHERLFEYLLIENILGENYKENNMGFSNAYMTLGNKYRDVLNGHRQCILPFPRTASFSKTAISARGNTTRTNSLTMSKRAEPWNDDDWHSDKEHDDEPPMPPPSKTAKTITRKVGKSGGKTVASVAGSSKTVASVAGSSKTAPDADALRLQKLADWRKNIAARLKMAQTSVVNDEALELIAVILPMSEQSLMEEIEGMTESKINQIGKSAVDELLQICRSYNPNVPTSARGKARTTTAAARPAEKAAEKAKNPSTYLQRYMNKSNEQETPTRTKKTTTVTAAIAVPRATTSASSVPISSVTTLRGVVSKSGSAIRVPAKAKAKF